jgi:hypothetical protein
MESGVAIVVYGDPGGKLLVAYPVEFSSEGLLVQGIPDSAKRPEDAVSEVQVLGEPAHLERGLWSEETVMQGPSINPDDAEWDYDAALTLYFDFDLPSGETIGIWVQARESPADWINGEELVRIAESFVSAE